MLLFEVSHYFKPIVRGMSFYRLKEIKNILLCYLVGEVSLTEALAEGVLGAEGECPQALLPPALRASTPHQRGGQGFPTTPRGGSPPGRGGGVGGEGGDGGATSMTTPTPKKLHF